MSASGGLARLNLVVVAIGCLLAGAAVGWAIEAIAPVRGKPVKMVEVIVAARDLHLGTPFTPENVDALTTTIRIPRAELPKNCVVSKSDLVGKRLYRLARQGELFNDADVKNDSHVSLSANHDFVAVPITRGLGSGFVGTGSRVDLIAVFDEGDRREVFTLLPDMHVMEVDGSRMSFAMNEKQAALVDAARHANCHFELLLRHPDSPKREFDHDAALGRIKGLVKVPEVKVKVQPKPEPKPKPKPEPSNHIVAITMPVAKAASGSVLPGSRVDVHASVRIGEDREVFVLVPDLLVTAVIADANPNIVEVAFAVNDKQLLLLDLAYERDCTMELALRKPDAPRQDFEYGKTVALLKSLPKKPVVFVAPSPRVKPTVTLPIAPAPHVRGR